MHLIQIAGISYMAFEASRKEFETIPADDAQADAVQPAFWQRITARARVLISSLFPSRSHHEAISKTELTT